MTQALLTRPTAVAFPPLEDRAAPYLLDEPSPGDRPDAELDDDACHNLPAQPTRLLGREREIELIRRLLGDEGVRLLTLTGPGGVGKTRLAVAAAEALLAAFPDGAWFVDLASLADPAAIMPAVAAALGVRDGSGRPVAERVRRQLRGRRLLVVLDNCEQLLPAAGLAVANLLAACPGLTVLATSREPLHLRWEHRLPVLPLGLPDPSPGAAPAALLAAPAVALFVERAQGVWPDFALTAANAPAVAELCRRLDGLPLAIELAAARCNVLPPTALLARLERRLPLPGPGAEDAPERHRTLPAAIGWSYEPLSPEEQALFRRLGVFAGGWTLAAAEAVCAGEERGLDPLDGLLALLDRSLIHGSGDDDREPRFEMLKILREYALEQLDAAGELEETRRRHAMYYAELAERAAPELFGPRRAAWLDRLDREDDNLRAALGWATERGEAHAERATRAVLAALGAPAQDAPPDAQPGPSAQAPRASRGNPLSEREREVLRLVAQGLPSKQIGRELALAERTIKAHVTGAFNKLGADTRAQAVALAIERGLL